MVLARRTRQPHALAVTRCRVDRELARRTRPIPTRVTARRRVGRELACLGHDVQTPTPAVTRCRVGRELARRTRPIPTRVTPWRRVGRELPCLGHVQPPPFGLDRLPRGGGLVRSFCVALVLSPKLHHLGLASQASRARPICSDFCSAVALGCSCSCCSCSCNCRCCWCSCWCSLLQGLNLRFFRGLQVLSSKCDTTAHQNSTSNKPIQIYGVIGSEKTIQVYTVTSCYLLRERTGQRYQTDGQVRMYKQTL